MYTHIIILCNTTPQDKTFKSSVDGIYAAGDVIGPPMLASTGVFQAQYIYIYIYVYTCTEDAAVCRESIRRECLEVYASPLSLSLPHETNIQTYNNSIHTSINLNSMNATSNTILCIALNITLSK